MTGPSSSTSPQLDLASLTSYSTSWPPTLRFAVCIAVRHASQSLCKRVEALTEDCNFNPAEDQEEEQEEEVDENGVSTSHQPAATEFGSNRRIRKRLEFKQDWEDFSEKFVTATCQHLGVSQEVLPPGENTIEDIMTISQGRIIDDEFQHQAAKQSERTFETGSSFARLHPELVVLSDSPEARRPKETVEIKEKGEVKEKEAAVEEPRNEQIQEASPPELQELDPLPASDIEGPDALKPNTSGADEPQDEVERSTSTLPSYMRALSLSRSKQDANAEDAQTSASTKIFTPLPSKPLPARAGGALAGGREVEVVHELALIALGLGQFRAEDGVTTLFEQDALFGDMGLDAKHGEEKEEAKDEEISAPQETSTPSNFSTTATTPTSTTKAWGAALKSGASTSWKGISSGASIAGKGIADASRSVAETVSSRAEQVTEKKKGKGPVKPNELCHYDSRARAIIFVAATSMGCKGKDVFMGEKVLGQSIYFLMSEGRSAAQKKEGKDPLDNLPAGADLDVKTGRINSSSAEASEGGGDRKSWMNSISSSAVAKEKGKSSWGKNAAIAGGFVLGGTIIGLTGGLAAPIIAPALVGLTGASFLATGGGIIMMGTLLGLGGGGLAGYRVKRRLRGVEDFSFHEIPTLAQEAGVSIPSLHATICIPGLLLKPEDHGKSFVRVFEKTIDSRDSYLVEFERDLMVEAGKGLNSYVLDQALRSGGQKVGEEILKHTALAGFAALTLPLTVIGAAGAALDGLFSRAKTKSHRAGLILAETLKAEVQGHRPVILVGTSLGCATILSALLELAKSPEENSHLVESVYLISAPLAPSTATWKKARSVVSRRFVNCHSSRDMVSAIAAWLGSGISIEELRSGRFPRVAGNRAIVGVPGLENYQVDDIIESHFHVNEEDRLKKVLERCGAMES